MLPITRLGQKKSGNDLLPRLRLSIVRTGKRGKGEECCSKQRVRPLVEHGGAGCLPEDDGEEDVRNKRKTLMRI